MTACTRSSRLARGGIGALIGGVAGSVLGFGVSLLLMKDMVTSAESGGMPSTGSMMGFAFGPVGVGLLGAGVGATVGAWKPQCESQP
jgi:hypothetical protein